MPYTSLTDLIARYGTAMLVRLTDRADVATGTIDTGVVDRALADTDAEIDGFLMVRYTLPMAQVPALIRDIALSLAIWKLHVYTPDEKIAADYKEATRKLGQLSSGVLRLNVAGVEPEGAEGSGVTITDRERPFTDNNLKGYI